MIIIALTSFSKLAIAQNNNDSDFNIAVNVSADNTYQNLLKHYLIKGISEINDVNVVGFEFADHVIEVVSLRTSSGLYVASVVFKTKLNQDAIIQVGLLFDEEGISYLEDEKKLAEVTDSLKNNSQGRAFRIALLDAFTSEYHSVYTDGDLQNLADRIVADINIDVFQEERDSNKRIDALFDH